MTTVRVSLRRMLASSLAVLPVCALLAALAVALAWPWLPSPPPGGPALARYAPLRDGGAALFAKYGPSGVESWESQNVAIVPGLSVFQDLPGSSGLAVVQFYGKSENLLLAAQELRTRLADVQIVHVRGRELGATEQARNSSRVIIRDDRGEFLVATHDVEEAGEVLFDPPILTLPSDLEVGASWESEGVVGGPVSYTLRGRVLRSGEYVGAPGTFEDCLEIETRLVFAAGERTVGETDSRAWYCADVGLVETISSEAGGARITRALALGTGAALAAPEALPRPAALADAVTAGDADDWTLTRVGRVRPPHRPSLGTIPPLWIPTDPPVLLVAGLTEDLVALDADGEHRWRFHPGGTIFGPPAFDPVRGRIYFGASDKRLYALDARGLFLWAFETGDNVASCPLVAEDVVVFGSEDRDVYGLDAATGTLRWRESTGGPVVSCPALADGVVVIGSDDGGVYGLDAQTGERRWLYVAGKGVEAPIVHADGTVYVAARDGSLAALDPDSGETAWVTPIRASGAVLKTAPAVGSEHVFVVDEAGALTAVGRQDGRRLWATQPGLYVGPPVLVGQTLILAGKDGNVYRRGVDGGEAGQWTAADASGPVDPTPQLSLGPSLGGGAAWLVDGDTVVRRLGSRVGPEPLPLAWSRQDPSLTAPRRLRTSAVEYAGAALLVDERKQIHLVDPATGRGAWSGSTGLGIVGETAAGPAGAGSAADGGALARTDPVVAGDVLLAVVGDTLHATGLPDSRGLWQFRGDGVSRRPVAVDGDTVLWLTAASPGGGLQGGTLHALDLATGGPRWQVPIPDVFPPGGVVVRDGRAFTSTPPARFDLATGERRWQVDLVGQPLGGPALDEAGDTLFVGMVDPETSRGTVVALDAADGSERWRAELGPDDGLSPLESLWAVGGLVIVPSASGPVVALDQASGMERWRWEPTARRFGAVTVADGRVWAVLANGRVHVLDLDSGAPVARYAALELDLLAGYAARAVPIGGTVIVPLGSVLLGFQDEPALEGGGRGDEP